MRPKKPPELSQKKNKTYSQQLFPTRSMTVILRAGLVKGKT